MNEQPAVGFIGFGEAGSSIAAGLRSAGIERLFAFDIASDSGKRGGHIRECAEKSRTTLVGSSSELVHASDVLFSTVTSSSSMDAARQTAPFLEPRHLYADLNSVSPALKRAIGVVISDAGARFVEAAVMAPVLPYHHRVPMLLGGPGAPAFAALFSPRGMRLETLGGDVGTAAAVKMCRSIVVKGLEALLCECVLGASQYGADDHVFASLNESFPGIDWKKLANYTMGRLVVHGDRRAREVVDVRSCRDTSRHRCGSHHGGGDGSAAGLERQDGTEVALRP
jgi:3-hydroxyisobutyrate dehydrogenase-like beta-hydroxyacid dehydrogenase